ncbi:subtilisin-like protein [Neocallimastix sp. 'constans']
MTKYFFFYFILYYLIEYNKVVYGKDGYYLIRIKYNPKKEQLESEDFINNKIESIFNVIKNNVETYNEVEYVKKEIDKYENFENLKRKRHIINDDNNVIGGDDKLREITDDTNLVYNLSEYKDSVLLYGYLNENITKYIKEITNIENCVPDTEMFDTPIETSDDTYETLDLNKSILDKEESQDIIYYDTEAIKSETKWKKVNIQTDSYNHLSLVSQFKYDKNIINSYDNNYYFSEKAGEGTDIFIIDDGINTMHVDFQNQKGYHINKRTVKCDAIIINAKVEEIDENDERSKLCTVNPKGEMPKHGTYVASVAGGFYFGVAKKANIHVIASDMTIGSVIKSLEYIKNLSERSTNYINPHKTIINISNGTYDIHEYTDLKNYLNKIIDLGFIVIASAGNNNVDGCTINHDNISKIGYHIPSSYDRVISVGSVGVQKVYKDKELKGTTEEIYSISDFSNYGNCTDIFAPGFVHAAYFYENNVKNYDITEYSKDYKFIPGTSYSAPIVAGVISLIISENPEIEYNQEMIREKLIEQSQKNILVNKNEKNLKKLLNSPNVFINNGKRIVYSRDNIYNKNYCGIFSGNQKCSPINSTSKLNCCSADGICGTSSKYCLIFKGCQSEFGECAKTGKNKLTIISSTKDNKTTSTIITTSRTTIKTKIPSSSISKSTTISTFITTSIPVPISTSAATTNTIISINKTDSSLPTTFKNPFITSDHKLGWIYNANIKNENNNYLCLGLENNYSYISVNKCNNEDTNKWYIPYSNSGYFVNFYNSSLCLDVQNINQSINVNLCSNVISIDNFIKSGKIKYNNYCLDMVSSNRINFVTGNKCKNNSKSQNWKFSTEFNKIGNDENNSNIKNYVSLDAKKSWIYNPETKLCLYWNNSSSISKPYLKECSNSNNNLWYISNNLSYFVSYKDSSFCLFVNTSGTVTIKKCEYGASLLIYSKNKIKYSDLNNIDKCLGIQNYNNKMNKENITVTMNECNNDNKDQNWIISPEFPSNL